MSREEYNACVAEGMSGKQLSGDARKLEFCVVAKLCSGKAKSREEAKTICSQPKEPKPEKTKRGKRAKGMLGENCGAKLDKLHACVLENVKPGSANFAESLRFALGECACGKEK